MAADLIIQECNRLLFPLPFRERAAKLDVHSTSLAEQGEGYCWLDPHLDFLSSLTLANKIIPLPARERKNKGLLYSY